MTPKEARELSKLLKKHSIPLKQSGSDKAGVAQKMEELAVELDKIGANNKAIKFFLPTKTTPNPYQPLGPG